MVQEPEILPQNEVINTLKLVTEQLNLSPFLLVFSGQYCGARSLSSWGSARFTHKYRWSPPPS